MKLAFFIAAMLPAFAWAFMREEEPAPALAVEPLTDDFPAQLDAPSFLESIGIMAMAMTRGERNNNPGNIRQSASQWQGKVAGSDPSFEAFVDPQAGIRALAKLLQNYQVNYGLKTVRQIVTRWAPPGENNTEAYVRAVAYALDVNADDPVNLKDGAMLERLTAAIIHHENGRNIYAASTIAAAVRQV